MAAEQHLCWEFWKDPELRRFAPSLKWLRNTCSCFLATPFAVPDRRFAEQAVIAAGCVFANQPVWRPKRFFSPLSLPSEPPQKQDPSLCLYLTGAEPSLASPDTASPGCGV